MQFLIDGYNLMYAVIDPGFEKAPRGLRKARTRFLNELAHLLGPFDAARTTVVFDATKDPPTHLPKRTQHKGLTVLFAPREDVADALLETMIAQHSAPKMLTVVSTDHRVRQAATRRRARALTSDAFWDHLKSRRARPVPPVAPPTEPKERTAGPTPEQSAYWQSVFADVVDGPEAREVFEQQEAMLTDEEIRAIERELRAEDDDPPRHRPRK